VVFFSLNPQLPFFQILFVDFFLCRMPFNIDRNFHLRLVAEVEVFNWKSAITIEIYSVQAKVFVTVDNLWL
ncbi:MAG: hypothetical protein K2J49_03795, partial [Muribaculaceae bacterium]|nr:hypothetical protein [Muribaculaceae bacterium]